MKRCRWVKESDTLYVEYHDQEWGRKVQDDQRLFERLSLEGMQAGLSWITVLKKREAFRKAFFNFDIDQVASLDEEVAIPELMQNKDLIRSEKKLKSIIHNARIVRDMQKKDESLTEYLWSFAPQDPFCYAGEVPIAQTPESEAMSRSLKKRGFTYIGPVICYALMQATGMVQDHLVECELHRQILE